MKELIRLYIWFDFFYVVGINELNTESYIKKSMGES